MREFANRALNRLAAPAGIVLAAAGDAVKIWNEWSLAKAVTIAISIIAVHGYPPSTLGALKLYSDLAQKERALQRCLPAVRHN